MPRPKLVVGVLSGLAIFGAQTSLAQTPEPPPGIYSPKAAVQSPPLRVEVVDGTRFRDIETHAVYRLYGIETCAPEQTARLGRQPWPCGTMATAWLVKVTLNVWLACRTLRDEAGEHLARCASAGHPDIAADMVREGVAVARPPSPDDPRIRAYALAEQDARKAYRGLWASTFQMPWDWRANHDPKRQAAAQGEATP
ncbi:MULTISPECIES: thermonuclease family protein [Nitrobacteraceae]|jgi:endonuclease YncB( thermonuclease family)|uniref:Nuclease n=1 Tax=Rhodopseudomonas palustris TaxID=1076 RepID=A0A0D7F0V1_RHOPL|nr:MULTISPECIES: thermonuclease family protein [Nitrobacteraceae]KIZ46703.1 nuclease [Rhodopseudomonas palustris]KQW18088.1 nuclease [Afipia sp. Root123D2]MCW5703802.1 thermonuclease family protein [Bradyrhizobium sp.]WOK21055.1 thermonuclease family protein [Rhodopseudomonas sp. BAL398]